MNRRSSRRRSTAAVLLGSSVTGVVLAVLAAGHGAGGGRPTVTPTSVRHEQVQVAIASGKVLFVGASYTVGLGATTPAHGYAPVLATRLDRRFTVAAVSGTGFLNPGSQQQGTFADRIQRLPASLDPRIVVIQGGRNDTAFPAGQLQQAAQTTITLARRHFVHARVVVMGPIPAVVPVSPRLFVARDAVRAAARATGAGFVDPLAEQWITASNAARFAGPIKYHPNDAGYTYIAGRLLADLPAALERSAAPFAGTATAGGAGARPADVAVPASPHPNVPSAPATTSPGPA